MSFGGVMSFLLRVCLKSRSHCLGVRPGTSQQIIAGGSGWTGTNREETRMRSYIPGSATDQNRFGAKRDNGLSRLFYGLRRCIPSVASGALRCVLARPDSSRLCPGISANIFHPKYSNQITAYFPFL